MPKLLIATKNTHKTKEITAILGDLYEVSDLLSGNFPDVAETGSSFLENASLKATEISKLTPDTLVLSDDSGLEVDALNKAPGIHSAYYAGEHGNHEANNIKLLTELAKLPPEASRTARFKCVMVIAQEGNVLASFEGTIEGTITTTLNGTDGFGYDPLFIPQGHHETFAELGDTIKNQLSHRAIALNKAIDYLSQQSTEKNPTSPLK